MTALDFLPIGILALLVATMAAGRRLSHAMQPLRLEAAERGEWLLAQKDLPAYYRADVEFMLRNMFGFRVILILTITLSPLIPVLFAFSRGFRDELRPPALPDPEAVAHHQRVNQIFWQVAMISHPLLLPISCLMIWLVSIPTLVLAALVKGHYSSADTGRFVRAVDAHTPWAHG